MKRFSDLFQALDGTTSSSAKIEAMADYFCTAPPEDAAWAVYLLTGRRLRRVLRTGLLRTWTAECTGYPDWLVEETHASVGDLAETVALLLPESSSAVEDENVPLHVWMEQRVGGLRGLDEAEQRCLVTGWWDALPAGSRFLLNKFMTGGFRVGVARRTVVRALAEASGLERDRLAHRLMGRWTPSAVFFRDLISAVERPEDEGRPYPFFLASPLQTDPYELGALADWLVEWKWDGIRAQILRREEATHVWSRGEEPMDGRFPEVEQAVSALPAGTVLDGEIVAWADGAPLPFASLQRRIGRLRPDARILREAPVRFVAYDLLEADAHDWREQPLDVRRARLGALLKRFESEQPGFDCIGLSPAVQVADWSALARLREQARRHRTEGFMLKRRLSPYRVGRVRGDWWKWKVDPQTVDAVLLYAQAGHGRRSNLFTDYTFGIWRGDDLVPVAKAYSGLDQAEIEELDRWIRRNTLERFGPVRSVRAEQVFELACDGLQWSNRHRAGVTMRFPRIERWRRDLAPAAADHLEDVRRLVDG